IESPANYRVVPCVGAVPFPFESKVNEGEIAELVRLPLSASTHPRLVAEAPVKINRATRTLRIYHVGNRQIWGLTARVLQNLLARLGMEVVEEGSADPMPVPALRIARQNAAPVRADGEYVLYWMIAARRLASNFA